MRNIYNISFSRAAMLLLPFIIRQRLVLAFIAAFMQPLERMNEEFESYRSSLDTSVNSQICYMRAMLNNHFDYYERRIRVRTVMINEPFHLLWSERQGDYSMLYDEDGEEYTPLPLLNSDGQIGSDNKDFEIVFPEGHILSDNDKNQLAALVNNHKLASKIYQVTNG